MAGEGLLLLLVLSLQVVERVPARGAGIPAEDIDRGGSGVFGRARDRLMDLAGVVLAVLVVAAFASLFLWFVLALRALVQEAQ